MSGRAPMLNVLPARRSCARCFHHMRSVRHCSRSVEPSRRPGAHEFVHAWRNRGVRMPHPYEAAGKLTERAIVVGRRQREWIKAEEFHRQSEEWLVIVVIKLRSKIEREIPPFV